MTKKERRQMRRDEARAEQLKSARGKIFRRAFIWGVVIAVLVWVGWLVWNAAKNAPAGSGDGTELAVPVGSGDNAKGPEDAAVTLVEYGDYQCPACGQFHPVVEQLFEEADGQMRLVFRHFPLKSIHPNAETAARAVEAAGIQGKYWEMHTLVFERQTEWAPLPRPAARSKLLEYASELGLDADRLDGDMDSDAVKDKIETDIKSGEAAAVNATPTFFVNGVRLAGANSFEEFRQQILGSILSAEGSSPDSHDDAEGTPQPAP